MSRVRGSAELFYLFMIVAAVFKINLEGDLYPSACKPEGAGDVKFSIKFMGSISPAVTEGTASVLIVTIGIACLASNTSHLAKMISSICYGDMVLKVSLRSTKS